MRVDLGLNPVQGGVLANKVVVIDADHTPSMDPMIQGYRSSDLNIMVANRLRMLLEASGTNAIMIRTADIPMSPVHRVVKSAGGGAEMHVIVRHSPIVRGNRVVISHYPRSVAGEWFANLLREEMAHLGWKRIVVREEASIVMRHTPSPTVSVNVQTGREVGESDHPVDPSIRLEAYAIYNALLRYFGAVEEDHSELYGVVQDEEGAPLGAAYVAVDGVLTLRADEKGRFHLRLLDSGYHELFAVAEGFVGWSHDLFIDSGRPDSVRIVLERDAGGP